VNPGTAALARGLEALEVLAREPVARDGLGVLRLADLVGADKSQMSRTLATLEEHGFVLRDPETLAYRLGWRLFGLAAQAAEQTIVASAPPVLRSLVARLDESAHLSVRQGTQVLTLLTESPASTIHAPGRVGGLTPVATTSAGRALCIDLEPQELDALGLSAFVKQIVRAREDGYAIVREEFEPGLVAAAAPVRDAVGRVIAAINVSAPAFRFEHRLEEAAHAVVDAAAQLSVRVTSATLR
jgi:IclR family KDG regulon transcriptional repressor